MQEKGIATILGIDPGYDRLGWAIVQPNSTHPQIIASGCIQTNAKTAMHSRYQTIQQELSVIITTYTPTECGIENLFFTTNAKTVMRVSEIRGLIIGLLLQNNVAIHDYTPMQIKAAITGNGRATKPEVTRMISLLTKCEKLPKLDDEVDAIAVALCHAASRTLRRQI